MKTHDFAGPYVVHCHWLTHEDLGCMAYINVEGDFDDVEQTYFDANYTVSEIYRSPDVNTKDEGQPLTQPPVISHEDFQDGNVKTTLYMDAYYYDGPEAQYYTRTFNGGIPGPTLRLKRGTTVEIEYHNLLGDNVPGEKAENTIKYPNTTNLHTHGLHVSPNRPGDDQLFTRVEPGSAVKYTIEIPESHLGG
eukprot:UN24278